MTDFLGYYFIGLFFMFILMIIISPDFWQSMRNSHFAGKKDINKEINSFLNKDKDKDKDKNKDSKGLRNDKR